MRGYDARDSQRGHEFGFEVDPLGSSALPGASSALAAGAAHFGLVFVVALAALLLATRRAR
jgi:hypothetical protein